MEERRHDARRQSDQCAYHEERGAEIRALENLVTKIGQDIAWVKKMLITTLFPPAVVIAVALWYAPAISSLEQIVAANTARLNQLEEWRGVAKQEINALQSCTSKLEGRMDEWESFHGNKR